MVNQTLTTHLMWDLTRTYYIDMRNTTDAATWAAKYLGEPYEREGLLFPADDLRYYNGHFHH